MESFDNSQMAQSKHGPSLQHERRPSKRLPGIVQQIQLRLARPPTLIALRGRQSRHILHRQCHLGYILFNQ